MTIQTLPKTIAAFTVAGIHYEIALTPPRPLMRQTYACYVNGKFAHSSGDREMTMNTTLHFAKLKVQQDIEDCERKLERLKPILKRLEEEGLASFASRHF